MTGARAVIAAAVLLLGVSACSSDDPEPIVAPTPSSSAPSDPSTSPVSGPVAPTMPAEAMGKDAASAAAFVKFYWEMVNFAQGSGDLAGLRSLDDGRCRACDSGLEYLQGVFSSGGQITGGQGTVAIKKIGFVQEDGGSNAVVRFVLSTSPQQVNFPGSKRDESYSGGKETLNAMLTPSEQGWLMSTWGVEK